MVNVLKMFKDFYRLNYSRVWQPGDSAKGFRENVAF